jgi:hypothetical protein
MSPEQALAFSKQKILRFWGLTGQRGRARLILGRLHDLVLSPGDSKGSTLDPDTVANEHHSYFFPDSGHGAANAAFLVLLVNDSEFNNFTGTQPIPCRWCIYFVLPLVRFCCCCGSC